MRCPWCVFEGDRWELHRHLVDQHSALVVTRQGTDERMFYEIACPHCDFRFTQRVKPRWKDPGFLEEFRREIALVAFDQLLYHLEGVHG
ncbi:MAG: hypothetical protein QN198_01635 [Armatimonadota bacterium]|nr:hypothetical protein [Armatimonadota bacterium]MDR5702287.1 hypothetical protein [Armatimonadota bacterium]MDR7435408.1 hypothetical protein [Armatimonadota bacterium]